MVAPLNVVLVEDNELLREEMVDFLSRHGWQVHGVDCGEALSEWLLDAEPHIALIDVNLPYESGYSITQRLRDSHPDMGIVLLTARVRPCDRSEGYRSGADVYLTKPVQPEELIAVVDNLARRVRRHIPPAFYRLDREHLLLQAPSGARCVLTVTEAHVLTLIALSPDRIAQRDYLLDQLDMTAETLAVCLSRLRARCKTQLGLEHLLSAERNVGYRLLVPLVLSQ